MNLFLFNNTGVSLCFLFLFLERLVFGVSLYITGVSGGVSLYWCF